MGSMAPGDLVVHEYKKSVGILLEVLIDQKLMKNQFSIPWRYRVLWRDGIIKEHDLGTLRRVVVYDFLREVEHDERKRRKNCC
jgi:hypothetical protein